jgi:hypothetical protein
MWALTLAQDATDRSGAPVRRLWGLLFRAPVEEVADVEGDAQEVGGDKSKLRSADSDDANDRTVYRGHDPALPKFSANEHRGDDGQHARDIVEANVVEHLQVFRALEPDPIVDGSNEWPAPGLAILIF